MFALAGCDFESEDCQMQLGTSDCDAESNNIVNSNWDEGNWNDLEWK